MEAKTHYNRSYSAQGKADLERVLNGEVPEMDGAPDKMIQRTLPKGRIPQVCIIGAGFAGLRCAEILTQKGLKVMILEGRDRIGGRVSEFGIYLSKVDDNQVHQINQGGHVYDLGPNWIHGTNHNPILELAEKTNDITFKVSAMPPTVYDQSGQLMDVDFARKHYDIMWSIIADAFRRSKEEDALIPPEESLLDFFETQIIDMGLDEASSKLVLAMARTWGDFVGEPIEKQSLKFFWLEECIEGENLYMASTYGAILRKVGSAALANAELRLSSKVTSINSNEPHGRGTVSVTTASNEVFNFDEVIITCPLGWLKRNTSAFTPALPTPLVKAIEHISYGRLEKVYITFPKAFWQEDGPDATLQPFFSSFLSPTYTDQNPQRWTIECVRLNCLPESCAQPTLLFYVHGPCAQHVTSMINGLDQSSERYYARLNNFFAPYYSRLPNYNRSSPDCTPTSFLATNWQNDEFSGWGSYTTFQTSKTGDDVQLGHDIEVLREGCPQRRIWFAGEHTAPFVALGTTTGAYWSGQGIGRRVAEVYGMGGDK